MILALVLGLALTQQPTVALVIDGQVQIVSLQSADREYARLSAMSNLTVEQRKRHDALIDALRIVPCSPSEAEGEVSALFSQSLATKRAAACHAQRLAGLI